MPVVPLKDIIDRAYKDGYGVAAINIVNDLSLQAMLDAAVELRAPIIVQTSVKTVKSIGRDVLFAMWESMTAGIPVPVTLHLDHCPERSVISACLERGWNSVLFDAHELPVEENKRQTAEVVAEAAATAPTSRARSRASRGSRTASAPTRSPSGRPSRSPSTSSEAPASTASPRPSATPTASTGPRRRWTPSG
jgi:hypothetical protein